jgi:DNA-binding NarL/FixJ family response regulator
MDQVGGDTVYRGIDRRRSPRDRIELVVVIDAACHVKYSSSGKYDLAELNRFVIDGGVRLRPEIEAVVSKLIAEPGADFSEEPPVALLAADRVLRLSRLGGPDGTLYALIFGTNQNRDSLMRAAARYTLTRRQCDVLALILEGDSVGEIAQSLCITENTVQGYVKSLLSKTKSRNRPAMVAKVLEWHQGRVTSSGRNRDGVADLSRAPAAKGANVAS